MFSWRFEWILTVMGAGSGVLTRFLVGTLSWPAKSGKLTQAMNSTFEPILSYHMILSRSRVSKQME